MAVLDVMVAANVLVWLSCGLSSVILTPRNAAARSLLIAGALFGASRAIEAAMRHAVLDDVGFAVWRTVGEAAFLGSIAAILATLASFPDGVVGSPWLRRLVRTVAVAATVAPLLEAVGSPLLTAADLVSGERTNPFFLPPLAVLGTAGTIVGDSAVLWVVIGVAVIARRWWVGGEERRAQLRWPLLSVLSLALLLLAIAVGTAVGVPAPPEEVFIPLFFVALAMFPLALLLGITRHVRALERRLVESRARLSRSEDTTRRAIERDLHDGVQQQLVAMLSLVELASLQLSRDSEKTSATLRDLAHQTRAAMADLRETVRGIRPPVLQDAGIAAAIGSRISHLPADVTLDVVGELHRRWPADIEAAAYFTAIEAITNALKHAPGSAVRVRLEQAEARLDLRVEDSGPGIGDGSGSGTGLVGLRDRVESSGGTLEVTSRPGVGTVVRASFPALRDHEVRA